MPVSSVFNPVYDIIEWVSEHKIKIALLLAALAVVGGAVTYKNDKAFANDVDFGIKLAQTAIFGANGDVFSDYAQPTNTLAPTDAYAPANESAEEEYHFSSGIEVHGSATYNEKIQNELTKLKKIDLDEYNEVMLYLEVVREKGDSTVGKGVYTIPENVLDSIGYYALIHEKEHVKQNLEPTYSSYYKGKSGWYKEYDAVKKEVEVYAKHNTFTEEQKMQKVKERMKSYKGAYPKEYAQFISEK